jgi:hypothetical protein
MTAVLAFLYIVALGVILYTVYLLARNYEHKHRNKFNETDVQMDDITDGLTMVEIDKALNWMFQLGIIDSIEYNKMRMDCIPFAKRNR